MPHRGACHHLSGERAGGTVGLRGDLRGGEKGAFSAASKLSGALSFGTACGGGVGGAGETGVAGAARNCAGGRWRSWRPHMQEADRWKGGDAWRKALCWRLEGTLRGRA